MRISKIKLLASISITAFLVACASSDNIKLNYVKGTEDQIFESTKVLIESNNLKKADQYLNQLSIQYPFGKYNKQVELMSIYSLYKQKEYELALVKINRILSTVTPDYPYLDYILFMRGLVQVRSTDNFAKDLFHIDKSRGNLDKLRQSLISFYIAKNNLSPSSEYINITNEYIAYLENTIARYELLVGKFYFDKEEYLSSINRMQVVWSNFPDTHSALVALEYSKKSYEKLKLDKEAKIIEDKISKMKNVKNTGELPEPNYKKYILPSFINYLKDN